jgi:hypothetical protein
VGFGEAGIEGEGLNEFIGRLVEAAEIGELHTSVHQRRGLLRW